MVAAPSPCPAPGTSPQHTDPAPAPLGTAEQLGGTKGAVQTQVSLGPAVSTPLFQVQGPRSIRGCSSSRRGVSQRCCCHSGPGMAPLSPACPSQPTWLGAGTGLGGRICVWSRDLSCANSSLSSFQYHGNVTLESFSVLLAQVLGHSLGMNPDSSRGCSCPGRVCIMSPEAL